jgi:hypothetical protein
MYGQTSGESTYGGELPYWRAFVEATTNASAPDEVVGVGNPIAQGVGAASPDAQFVSGAIAISTSVGDVSGDATSVGPGVVLIEAIGATAPDVATNVLTVDVIQASAATAPDGVLSLAAVAVGTSSGTVSADATFEPVGIAIGASGATVVTADVTTEVAASATEAVPMTSHDGPEMLPLVRSHEADQLEAELKAIFLLMYETYIRPDERYVNVLGMPQHGPRELIEMSLANDGLSIYRGAGVASGAGAYLLRAWRAHNPKRGLHLLRTYLQLLWPNVWTADQMWQDKAEDYPTALSSTDGGNHFLTSRVNVSLPARVTSGGDLNAIQSGLRASLPARMVMELAIASEDSFGIGIATAYVPGFVAQSYEGTIS